MERPVGESQTACLSPTPLMTLWICIGMMTMFRSAESLPIVQTILEQEQKSTLYYDAQETYRPNLERLTETWFVQFIENSTRRRSKGESK